MRFALKQFIKAFQWLPPDQQREAASLILRSVAELKYPPLDVEALAQIADEMFQEYDAREASTGGRS